MQTLFEWDFSGRNTAIIEEALERNISEFGPGMENPEFVGELLTNIIKKQKVLDEIIEKAAPDWPIDKISGVDRNVLRLGLYELLFGDYEEVPPKVAINEAIELAKSFGGENSGKFINGVLGAIYKEIGEPGKDQTSKKKKRPDPVDLEKLPIEKKAGAVVYSKDDAGVVRLAMVHDVFGYWTLAKGGIDDVTDEIEGVKREIKEEIGVDIDVKDKLGENEYVAHHPTDGAIRKQVHYFLAEAPYGELTLKKDAGGLDDTKWFTLEEVPGLTMYDDIVQMITKAIKIITKK